MRYHIIYDGDQEWFCEHSYDALNEFAVCKLCGQYQRINKVEVIDKNGNVMKGAQ